MNILDRIMTSMSTPIGEDDPAGLSVLDVRDGRRIPPRRVPAAHPPSFSCSCGSVVAAVLEFQQTGQGLMVRFSTGDGLEEWAFASSLTTGTGHRRKRSSAGNQHPQRRNQT